MISGMHLFVAEIVESFPVCYPLTELSVIRHEPDNRFLECALAASAEFIVTVNAVAWIPRDKAARFGSGDPNAALEARWVVRDSCATPRRWPHRACQTLALVLTKAKPDCRYRATSGYHRSRITAAQSSTTASEPVPSPV